MRNRAPNYQPLPGVLNPIPIREFRGLNTFDALNIEDSFLQESLNMTSDDYPVLTTRQGWERVGSYGTKVLGLAAYEDKELHAVFSDGTWRRYSGGSWTTLRSGLDTSADWSFTHFEGNFGQINLVGCNGVNGLMRYNGSTVQTFGNASSSIKYICTYSNRLWGAVGNEIWASRLDDGTVWDDFAPVDAENSFRRVIENNKGEDISMIASGLTKLIIGMPNSLHEQYGSKPSDFSIRQVTEQSGVINNRSAFVDGALRFIHRSGLYEYVSGGQEPYNDFAQIVREYLSSIPADACAGSDARRMYYKTTAGLLVNEAYTQTWHLWDGFDVRFIVTVGADTYIGDSTGRVYRYGGSTDDGNSIYWRVISKRFSNASIAQRTRWLKVWVVIEILSGSVQVSLSDSLDKPYTWTQVANYDYTGLGPNRIILPLRSFELSNNLQIKIEGTGRAKIYEITRQGRVLSQY